ncbi:ATPase domain-containing protein [Butyrivibrio sp. AE2032]|uniref:ATPase domain-containing protein n=1 Tax=Butyrivibrio sp. AE2032 TaxID=1458463 RepID=UPI00054E3BB3|nr:ATPase domain-containing protein [Butyrivibrio sp. AE2032]
MSLYEFNPDDARAFAKSQGIQVKERGDEIHFKKCPYCGNTTNDKYTFAINKRSGMYKCLRAGCGASGNMITLAQDFNFSLGSEIDEYYRPKKEYKSFKKPEKIIPKAPAVKYLESRGISEAVAKRYEITNQTDKPDILVIPFLDPDNTMAFIKYRNTKFNKDKDQNKEWCEAGGKPILFGMAQCNTDNKTLIITEGQMDSLSVIEAGYENAVSVPNGCNGFTWVPYCWDWIQNFTTIIVFGDYEKGHMTLLDDIKRRFKQTIKHVRYEDYKDCKDANAILQKYGKDQIKVCIDNAQAEPIKHIRDLSEVEVINPYDIPKIKTGIRQLDALLKGGLPIGGVTLITGKAGEGKSVLASQIMLEARDQGHKVFAYSGELTDTAFKAIAMLQAGGSHCYKYQSLSGYDGYTLSENNQVLIDNWMKGNIYIYDDSIVQDEEETTTLTKLIEDTVNSCGVDFVIIDNLMTALELEENTEQSKYDQQSTFVKRLARLARTLNIVIVLVAHMRKNNSNRNGNDEVAGSSDITNLASITLMYEKDDQLSTTQRSLKVWKNRLFGYTNTEGFVMDYDERSKRIYSYGDNPNKDYSWYIPVFEQATELPFEV